MCHHTSYTSWSCNLKCLVSDMVIWAKRWFAKVDGEPSALMYRIQCKLYMQFEMSCIRCDQGGRRTLCSPQRRKEGATVVDEEMSSTMLRWQNFVLFLNWLCWLNMVEVTNLKTKMLRSWCRNYSLSFPSFSAGPRCQLIFNLESMCWASDGIASAPDRFPSVCIRHFLSDPGVPGPIFGSGCL